MTRPSNRVSPSEERHTSDTSLSSMLCLGGSAKFRRQTSPNDSKLPHWLTKEQCEKTTQQLWGRKNKVSVLRGLNRKQQLDQEVWQLVLSMFLLDTGTQNNKNNQDRERRKRELFNKLEENPEIRVSPGPVGDLPMHACFLLGLADVGKEMVERFYSPGKDQPGPNMNSPYESDLQCWKDLGVLDPDDPHDDGGLYTGETCLHIAIVQYKDKELVKWMIDHGARVTARATGAFFKGSHLIVRQGNLNESDTQQFEHGKQSVWQKVVAWVRDDALHSRRKLPNHFSACDYGEFPLSFAASVGSVEICELLVEMSRQMSPEEVRDLTKHQRRIMCMLEGPCKKDDPDRCHHRHRKHHVLFHDDRSMHSKSMDGVDVEYSLFCNAQDTAGNTALHMAVVHNQVKVFDWLMKNGGKPSLRLLNAEGLTPFTLAAKLGYSEMVYHILDEHMREVSWKYGQVHMSKMSLEQLDSFRVKDNALHAMPNWRSAIEIIVEHEVVVFSKDDLFNKLIMEKWENFGRMRYLTTVLFPYLTLLSIFTTAVTLRCIEIRKRWDLVLDGDTSFLSGEHVWKWHERITGPHPGMSAYDVRASLATFALHVIVSFGGVPWLVYKGWLQRRLGKRDIDPEEDGHRNYVSFFFKNMTFVLNFFSAGALIVTIACRFSGNEEFELDSWAVACVFVWVNLLTLIVPFKFFGVIIITMYRMIVGDLLQFFMAYVMVTVGFSLAIYVLFQRPEFPDDISHFDTFPGTRTILQYFWISLGDDLNQLEVFKGSRTPSLLLTFHLVYIVLTTLLLLNLLIAMMGQTFQANLEDTHRTWVFPFASLVLRYERLLSEKECQDPLGRYRSGKFAGTDEDDEDEHNYWKSVFYEIDVGVNKKEIAEGLRRQTYEREHAAILDKLEKHAGECKNALAAKADACMDDVIKLIHHSQTNFNTMMTELTTAIARSPREHSQSPTSSPALSPVERPPESKPPPPEAEPVVLNATPSPSPSHRGGKSLRPLPKHGTFHGPLLLARGSPQQLKSGGGLISRSETLGPSLNGSSQMSLFKAALADEARMGAVESVASRRLA